MFRCRSTCTYAFTAHPGSSVTLWGSSSSFLSMPLTPGSVSSSSLTTSTTFTLTPSGIVMRVRILLFGSPPRPTVDIQSITQASKEPNCWLLFEQAACSELGEQQLAVQLNIGYNHRAVLGSAVLLARTLSFLSANHCPSFHPYEGRGS